MNLGGLTLAFVGALATLKIIGILSITWFQVFVPVLLLACFVLLSVLTVLIIAVLAKALSSWSKSNKRG